MERRWRRIGVTVLLVPFQLDTPTRHLATIRHSRPFHIPKLLAEIVGTALGVTLSGAWGLTGWAEDETGLDSDSPVATSEPHDAVWDLESSAGSSREALPGSHGFGEGTQPQEQAFQSSMGGIEMPHDSWTQGGRDGSMGESAQGWQSIQMPTSGFGMPEELSSQSQTSATEPAKDMTEQLQQLGIMSEQGVQIDRVGSQQQVTIPNDVQEMLKSQQATQPTMMRGAEQQGASSGTWTHTAPQEQRNLMGTNDLMGNQRDVSAGAHDMGRNSGGSSPSAPSEPISLSGQGVVEIRQDSGPGAGRGGSGGEGRHR